MKCALYLQGDSKVPVHLYEYKYTSHGELTVTTRQDWLKKGSGQGHAVTWHIQVTRAT
jgi:hypothetical protein